MLPGIRMEAGVTRMMSLLCWFIALACITPLVMAIFIDENPQLEWTFSYLLSTEAVTPALILVSALAVYFVHRAQTA